MIQLAGDDVRMSAGLLATPDKGAMSRVQKNKSNTKERIEPFKMTNKPVTSRLRLRSRPERFYANDYSEGSII